MSITVRTAKRNELECVNELRKMVNEIHVNGRPDVFRQGFCDELRQHVYDKFKMLKILCYQNTGLLRFTSWN